MAEIDSRVVMELVSTIITPVNAGLAKHSEAMSAILAAVQRIADIVQQEPTRRTLLEAMREELARLGEEYASCLKEHDKMCERRGGQWNAEDVRRAEDVLRQAIKAIEDHFEEHEDATGTKLKPVDDMKKRFEELIWTIRIAAGIGISAAGYLAYALAHLPVPGRG